MSQPLAQKRIACAAFRMAQKAVQAYFGQLRRENRHIVLKNPINAKWAAEALHMSERSVREWSIRNEGQDNWTYDERYKKQNKTFYTTLGRHPKFLASPWKSGKTFGGFHDGS